MRTNLKNIVDPNIYPIIDKLNKIGLTTTFCCAGYGESRPSLKLRRQRHTIKKECNDPYISFDETLTNSPIMHKFLDLIAHNNKKICIYVNNQIINFDLFHAEYLTTFRYDKIIKKLQPHTNVRLSMLSLEMWSAFNKIPQCNSKLYETKKLWNRTLNEILEKIS